MEVKSHLVCKGEAWYQINNKLVHTFFDTLWDAFKLCISIGILYDHAKEELGDSEDQATVPSNMFNRNSEVMSYFFKTAILTSNLVDFTEKDRLYLAFSEDVKTEDLEGDDRELLIKGVSEKALSFDKVAFLRSFANYGAEKLASCISVNDNETMENLMDFLNDSYDGVTEELMKMKELNEKFDDEWGDEVIE